MSATEPFWPPGWNRQRLINATTAELDTLNAEQSDRMYDGLRAALGPEGYAQLVQEITDAEEEQNRQAAAQSGVSANWIDQLTPDQRVPLLRTLQQYCPEGPFGWVVYRACSYDDQGQWDAFLAKWELFVKAYFERNQDVPGVAEAAARFEIRWIQDRQQFDGANVNTIAAHYRQLQPTLPHGLAHGMCLSIGESELRSVLDSPYPTPADVHEQLLIPFALAVNMFTGEDDDIEDGDEEAFEDYHMCFKVALTSLSNSLVDIMLDTSQSPYELSVGVDEDKVLLDSSGRFGIFSLGTPGVE